MRPIIPALAALAWGEPRRRNYWEAELLNALTIVDRGWAKPADMIGSWAGAMGHTQWMPEVWLHIGVDYDHDGRVSPFGKPDDALAGTARYLVERGNYRRGEAWGCEVKVPAGADAPRRQPDHASLTRNGTSSASRAPTARFRPARTTRRSSGCRSPAGRRSWSGRISAPSIPTIHRRATRWRSAISAT